MEDFWNEFTKFMVLKFGFSWSKKSLDGDLDALDCMNRISSSIFVSASMTMATVEAFGTRRAVFCSACCRSTVAAFSRITTNGSAAATLQTIEGHFQVKGMQTPSTFAPKTE